MKKNVLFSFVIIFLMVSCYPEGPEYYEDTDIVYTNYEESFDFAGTGTYAMPDQIVKVTGNLAEGEDPEFVKEPYNTQILSKIESNMSALGSCRSLSGISQLLVPILALGNHPFFFHVEKAPFPLFNFL